VSRQVTDRAGNSRTANVAVERRLSLASPWLNAGIRLRGRGGDRFQPLQRQMDASFRFIGHTAPWYARTAEGPPLVREAQWRLQRMGFLSKTSRPSGVLDLATIRGVQRYQAARGIPTLGTIGARTRAALDRDLLRGRVR